MEIGVYNFAYWHSEKRKVMYRLTREVVITHDNEKYVIPVGYETDFATIPRPIHLIIPRAGKWMMAALLHDWLYDNRIGTRKGSDVIFLELLLKHNINKCLAYLMYYSVRLGGGKWWDR